MLIIKFPEKIMDISIDATHKLSKKSYYKLFTTFQLMRVGRKANEQFEPALNQAISNIQEEIEGSIHRLLTR